MYINISFDIEINYFPVGSIEMIDIFGDPFIITFYDWIWLWHWIAACVAGFLTFQHMLWCSEHTKNELVEINLWPRQIPRIVSFIVELRRGNIVMESTKKNKFEQNWFFHILLATMILRLVINCKKKIIGKLLINTNWFQFGDVPKVNYILRAFEAVAFHMMVIIGFWMIFSKLQSNAEYIQHRNEMNKW